MPEPLPKEVLDIIEAVHALTDEHRAILFASMGKGEGGATSKDVATARAQQVEKLTAELLAANDAVNAIKTQLQELGASTK